MIKNKLYLLSFIITAICSLIPTIGEKNTDYHRAFGFPAQVFGYFSTGHFQFLMWNTIFNYFVFYFFLRVMVKLFSKILKKGSI